MKPTLLTVSLAACLAMGCAARASVGQNSNPIANIQILAFNDFHGAIEPPTGSSGRIGTVAAGGIEYLAAHVARLKAENANTVVVSAGDNIGASPLVSGMFHDEPSIEALGAAGLEIQPSATTSSTKDGRSCTACKGVAAIRWPAARIARRLPARSFQ